MSFDSLIKSRVIAHITSEQRQRRKRASFERKRAQQNAAHTIDYFHDASDPYSHLTAQVLRRLQDRYDIELRPHLISAPPAWAVPAKDALESYARLDAARLAERAGLSFPATASPPAPEKIAKVRALMAASLQRPDFAETAVATGIALWEDKALPQLPEINPSDAMDHGDALLAKRGHYLGATFYFGREWYWGVDRLHYLETRLRALGADRPGTSAAPIFEPPVACRTTSARPDSVIEAFMSFRSPYSYLAFDRARKLARTCGAEFRFRPVLPMVMRGLPVLRAKQIYILHDVAREARRLDIPFGRVCDPLGAAIERGYSLIGYARGAGRIDDYASSFLRGVWADGIDAKTDNGLARIVERAGLDWNKARQYLHDDTWRAEVEENRQALTALGLWGVPSFRVGNTAFWGQDRLWLIEAELTGPDSK